MPRPAKVDVDELFRVAARIAGENGLGGVTMHAVARELGVTPMALYRHVADKAALVNGMVNLVVETIPEPDPGLPWRDRLHHYVVSICDAPVAYPGIDQLFAVHACRSQRWRRVRDAVFFCLMEAGLPNDRASQAEAIVLNAALGFVAQQALDHRQWMHRDLRNGPLTATLHMIDLWVDDALRTERSRGLGRKRAAVDG